MLTKPTKGRRVARFAALPPSALLRCSHHTSMPTPVIDLSGSSPPAPAALAGLVPLPPLPPLPPRQRDLPLALRTAIDSADIITLRLVVATCAERDYATQTLATAMLVKKKDARQRDVKAEQWEMCIHCEGPFNSKDGVDRDADPELLSEEKNDMDEFAAECSWHPGESSAPRET